MMLLAIALFLIIVVLAVWAKHTRDARDQWIKDLDLMGTWEMDSTKSDDPSTSIRFTGNLSSGDFVLESSGEEISGTWKLAGTTLVLTSEETGVNEYEIRLFEHGSIGIHGADRERQVFHKRVENIVPLRRRS